MQAVLRDLGHWLWRLAPANPILVRVVHAGGRRKQHLVIRGCYLGVFSFLVVFGVIFAQSQGGTSLSDLAKSATIVFKWVAGVQLFMVCLLAPIFTAAAITQEKNSQTYNILLSTPLTNGQIVLGSLLSRLYFVFVLLLAGVPLFCIMMVYGGVTGDKILLSMALAACTATLTGSLAIAISVIRVGTGRTIFSFYLAIALYLAVLFSLSGWGALIPVESVPAPGETMRMSWLAPFHPFLSLGVVLGMTPAPDFGVVAHYSWPLNYWLAYPQYSYIVMTLLASGLLVVASLAFVRRGAKEGEPTFLNRIFRSQNAAAASTERTRKPRNVGRNPVAWREASTRAASGGAAGRYVMLALGLVIALIILTYYKRGDISITDARIWLFGIISVELGVTLFIATATAATSMTREKESDTLALLLATPITSSKIVWGKIRGLISFAAPMLALPIITLMLFVLADLFGKKNAAGPVVHAEALIVLPLLFVAFTTVACMIGVKESINRKKTLAAVFVSGAWLLGGIGVTSFCAGMVIGSSEKLAAGLMPLSPFYAIFVAIDPARALTDGMSGALSANELEFCRLVAFISSIVVAALYAACGYWLHAAMVRGFDMTIRKQMA